MISLKDGALLKLLEDMKMEEKDDPKPTPTLLQIRSIIPVLEEGDLWPNKGFYLKVSDSSHALYVSLSQDQNDMILCNKLQLGQFIHVHKLQKSHPLPLLRGLTPIPGRRSCHGSPLDIVPPPNTVKFLEASSNTDSVVEKGVILEKKDTKISLSISRNLDRGLSDSESCGKRSDQGSRRRCSSASRARPTRPFVSEKCCDDVDNDSDADSVASSASSLRGSKRRSWNESEVLGVKDIFDSSEIKLPSRSLSANVSPVRSVRCDSSDDNLSLMSIRRVGGSTKRLVERPNKRQTPTTKVEKVQISDSLVYETKGVETRISWNSLPSNLVKCGKELIRQRDVAVLAACDALQEACASERLLNSLSTFSQFPLAEGDDLQPIVGKFFDLQHDLARTRLIMQSLTSISPFRSQETESSSVKEALSIARERNKNANTWIKSAIALDLSPCFTPLDPPPKTTTNLKKTSPSNCTNKPRGSCIVKRNKDTPLLVGFDKEEQPEWSKGSSLSAAAELATSLQVECKKLFLSHVEKYLDEVDRKSSLSEYDGEMAEMMYKVKMVSDCLNVIVKKDGDRDGFEDNNEAEAFDRVKNKIYGILLKHVERTAMAFQRLNNAL